MKPVCVAFRSKYSRLLNKIENKTKRIFFKHTESNQAWRFLLFTRTAHFQMCVTHVPIYAYTFFPNRLLIKKVAINKFQLDVT